MEDTPKQQIADRKWQLAYQSATASGVWFLVFFGVFVGFAKLQPVDSLTLFSTMLWSVATVMPGLLGSYLLLLTMGQLQEASKASKKANESDCCKTDALPAGDH